jgi:hypothetical protein
VSAIASADVVLRTIFLSRSCEKTVNVRRPALKIWRDKRSETLECASESDMSSPNDNVVIIAAAGIFEKTILSA